MGMAQKKEEEGRNYVIGGLELNEDTIEFSVDGNPVKLTPIEFKILALLMRNPGRVFSTEKSTSVSGTKKQLTRTQSWCT